MDELHGQMDLLSVLKVYSLGASICCFTHVDIFCFFAQYKNCKGLTFPLIFPTAVVFFAF